MNWFKNRKSKNLAIDNVTLAKNGLYFNVEVNNNLKLSQFKFAQVAITGIKTFCVQFTLNRVNEATNYKVILTTKNAIKVNCIQFVDIYFNAREDVKHAKLQVKERDDQHLLIECTLEEEYNGTI
jgi:hypothetical protein